MPSTSAGRRSAPAPAPARLEPGRPARSTTSASCCRRSACTARVPSADIARLTRPDGADGLDDHQARCSTTASSLQGRAGARQGRPALGAAVAEPGRRARGRHQGRAPPHGRPARRLHRPRAREPGRSTTASPTPTRCSREIGRALTAIRRRLGPSGARACRASASPRRCRSGGWQSLLGIEPARRRTLGAPRPARARRGACASGRSNR